MNYLESINYIHSIPKFVRPLGNENLGKLLSAMGNPQEKLKFIHVAGTNGKGSVCAMTAEILKRAGYKTGLFTSPFIERFNERICVNNEQITDNDLAEYVTYVSKLMEKENAYVSEFAFITAVAFKYFYDIKCDIVVLETGMGGKLDATNIIPVPEVAAITAIGFDHQQYLGETLPEIAAEKAGIIKEGGTVVSAPNKNVADILKSYAEKVGAKLIICKKADCLWDNLVYKTHGYEIGLKGIYQLENAAIVVEIVDVLREKGYKISACAVVEGLKYTKWKARYEFVAPNIVIDGGHNIDGIRMLKKSLMNEKRDVVLVMAMMKDKMCDLCIHTIAPAAKKIILTEIDTPRCMECESLKKICDNTGVECIAIHDPEDAIDTAIAEAGNSLICICGSLYFAGEAEKILKNKGIFNF